jgi:hypothetical protein
MKSISMLFIAFAFLFVACEEKKVEPLPVGEMSEYKDPGYGFKIKYPKDWLQLGTTGNAVFSKSQEVIDKFQNPSTGIEGAMVTVQVIQYGGKPAEAVIQTSKDELKQTWQNLEWTQVAPMTADAKRTNDTYRIPITSKKSIIGMDLYVAGDTALYKVSCMAFGEDQAKIHTNILNEMWKSFEAPVVVAKVSDKWAGSPNLETLKSDYFTMEYPDNMEFVDAKKGSFDYAWERRADRFDCTIHIDVFGAKGLTVEKVWEQNKGKYRATSTGNTTIDGNKALWVNDSPRKDAARRTYFIVKNDKVIRATLNWFAPQKDIYFSVFEKCVNSLKLK